jgi:hypothetical protein
LLAIASRAWFLVHRILRRCVRRGGILQGSGADFGELSLWVGIGLPLAGLVGAVLDSVALSRLSVGVDLIGPRPADIGGMWWVRVAIGLCLRGFAALVDADSPLANDEGTEPALEGES